MTEKSYDEAIGLLRKHNLDPLPIKRPSVEDLAMLEQRLGVRLPDSYRRMLLDFGILMVDSITISGVGNDGVVGMNSHNVVFATESSRKDGLITDTMIEIGVAGYGPFFFIDCAELDGNGEAPVYEAPANGVQNGKDKLADSFGEYLLNEVRSITGDAPD